MNSFKNNSHSQAGFSVIEVLLVIFILTLMGAAVYALQKDVFSLTRFLSQSLVVQDEARRTLKAMTVEVRTASPSSMGAYTIAEATASSFTFYSNIDQDSLVERVRYFLEGDVLKKGVIKPTGIPLTYNPADEVVTEAAHDVANGASPVFSYYDTNYDGTSQPITEPVEVSAVRLVKITILIDRDPLQSPGAITLTTQISLRNLKDNL